MMGRITPAALKAAAMFLTIAVVACGQTTTEHHGEAPPNMSQSSASEIEAQPHDMQKLAIEKRVAFMSGHVEAGLALYRAGLPKQAAKHLLHPVSETHAAERAGVDALGFNQSVFEQVSIALEQGRPAEEIEPQLAAAEANIALLQQNSGGDPAAVIDYLMDTVIEEYRIGVRDGEITDPGEYQDAFGFTVVALDLSARIDSTGTHNLETELKALLALWPEAGPLADSTPTRVADLETQVLKVQTAVEALPKRR